jgi:phospholipid-binding lipoprotein MlaA
MAAFWSRSGGRACAALALSAFLLGACATPPSDPEARVDWAKVNDPLEPTNRAVFAFNVALDRAVFRPVAQEYHDVVPDYVRARIHDFLTNWHAPVVLANDVLQGNAQGAVETFVRFTFNTGFGLLGAFDLVGSGIPPHDNDLGMTLAVWGVGEGPYLVLPVLGPSNPRDALGLGVETAFDPVDYRLSDIDLDWIVYTRAGLSALDLRERNLAALDEIERNAIDYYSTMRSLYRQHREALAGQPTGGAAAPGPAMPDGAVSHPSNEIQ